MRRFGYWLGRVIYSIIAIVLLVYLAAPREPVDMAISFDARQIGDDPSAYLAAQESQFSGLSTEVAKQIVWAGDAGQKTPVALVYLHGFSATGAELRPVPQRVARELGANLFITRLTGHGLDGASLGAARAGDWIEDLAEAIAIGERLGDKIVLIGTSTGGTLAAIAVNHPDLADRLAGVILVSPNFRVQASAARLLEWPLARWWVPLVAGGERAFAAKNADHARYWTTRYPTVALIPMAALVKTAREADYTGTGTPALFVFADNDRVVSAEETRDIAGQWAGPMIIAEQVMGPGDDPDSHVIAGDILSPGQTEGVVKLMVNWVRNEVAP